MTGTVQWLQFEQARECIFILRGRVSHDQETQEVNQRLVSALFV